MPHQTSVREPSRAVVQAAGWAYVIPLALIVVSNFGLRTPLLARGDIADTMRRIAGAALRFRLSVALDIIYSIGAVVLISALYVILAPVSRFLATLAGALKILYVVTALMLVISLLTMLRLATDPAYGQSLGVEPLHGMFKLLSNLWWPLYYVGLAFWSVSATIFAWLWLRSRYVPKPLAAAGAAASAWCVVCAFAFLIDPRFANVVNLWLFDAPMVVLELVLGIWLLTRGTAAPERSPRDQ